MFAITANCINGVSVQAQAELDGHNFTTYQALSADIKARLRPIRRWVKTVYVKQGSDGHIFDDRTVFPNLEAAILNVNGIVNNQLLHALSLNYPNVKGIFIEQPEKLCTDSVCLLRCFRRLEDLELACNLEDASQLKGSVPKLLVNLFLRSAEANSWRFSDFPKLELLRFEAAMDEDFPRALNAPKLEELNIEGPITHQAISEIPRFHNLNCLYIAKGTVSHDDYEFLRKLPIREIICHHE